MPRGADDVSRRVPTVTCCLADAGCTVTCCDAPWVGCRGPHRDRPQTPCADHSVPLSPGACPERQQAAHISISSSTLLLRSRCFHNLRMLQSHAKRITTRIKASTAISLAVVSSRLSTASARSSACSPAGGKAGGAPSGVSASSDIAGFGQVGYRPALRGSALRDHLLRRPPQRPAGRPQSRRARPLAAARPSMLVVAAAAPAPPPPPWRRAP